jgi:RNA polymerase sigma-70 factor (ECF subfamily)
MRKKLQEKPDEELMMDYQGGDIMAYEVLYVRHSPRIYGYIRKQIGEGLAADALQETFIRLHSSRHLFNQELPFLPWLFTITKNICTDILRKEARYPKTVLLNEEIVASIASMPDSNEWLEVMMEKLSSTDQQQAIRLRYFQDWSFEEIAEKLKTTPTNSRKLVSRGLKQLKEIFTSHGGDDETK